jgi:hypothetical protein
MSQQIAVRLQVLRILWVGLSISVSTFTAAIERVTGARCAI